MTNGDGGQPIGQGMQGGLGKEGGLPASIWIFKNRKERDTSMTDKRPAPAKAETELSGVSTWPSPKQVPQVQHWCPPPSHWEQPTACEQQVPGDKPLPPHVCALLCKCRKGGVPILEDEHRKR